MRSLRYPTAFRAPKVPARNRAKLVQRRTQMEQKLSEGGLSPIEELRTRATSDRHRRRSCPVDQADRPPELEEAFVKVAASW
jgi:hypothetical protein